MPVSIGTGGVEAGDLQALSTELSRHQELLLERFEEHEERILDALSWATGGHSPERRSSALGGGPVMRRWSSEGEGRSVWAPSSPKLVSEWLPGRRQSGFVHRLVGHESTDLSLETNWTRPGAPVSGLISPPRELSVSVASQTDQEDPEQQPYSPELELLPATAGKRVSLDVPAGARGFGPSSLSEFEQPEQPAIKRELSMGYRFSSAATAGLPGMSYGMDDADAIDQSSKVATRLKELIGAEQDVHHRVIGLKRRNSVVSKVALDGWAVIARKANAISGSAHFEIAIAFLILFNAVVIGLRTNDAMMSPQQGTPVGFKALELLFLGAFAVELAIRIVAEGASFFSCLNAHFKWNMFDFTVVVAGVGDAIFMAVATDAPNVSAIRLLRILRLARVLRILRIVKFFSAFRVMVTGVLGSLKVLSFAVMLLTLIIYVFAVFILQFAVQEIQDALVGRGALGPDDYGALMQHFDSLPRAIFSLYASILGGLDWSEAASPLMALNPMLGGLFMLYIAFAVLCVLNIVTGVFVENANKITSQDEGRELLSQLTSKKEWLNEAIKLFNAHDVDGSGTIAWKEFKECAKDVKVQAWFRKIGVDVETELMHSLWELLDFDGDGQVDVDEFVMALQQIHGQAKSIDMARVKYEVRQIRKKVEACLERAEERRRPPSQQAFAGGGQSEGIGVQSRAPQCGNSSAAGLRAARLAGVSRQASARGPAAHTQLPGNPEYNCVQ